MPLHEIFEEYAKSNWKWIRDFVPAFEKMLQNGYRTLRSGPDQWTDVECTLSGGLCVNPNREVDITGSMYIVSDLDKRVLEQGPEGNFRVASRAPGAEPRQLWKWGDDNWLVNVQANAPLTFGKAAPWEFRSQASWYKPKEGHNVLAQGDKCIDRGWAKEDKSASMANCWGGPIQHWSFEELEG